MTFEPNAELDAQLVHAAFTGGMDKFMFAAMNLGLQPDEATKRAEWLKTQPKTYVVEVTGKVEALLDGVSA